MTTVVLFDPRTDLLPEAEGWWQQFSQRIKQNSCCSRNQSITDLLLLNLIIFSLYKCIRNKNQHFYYFFKNLKILESAICWPSTVFGLFDRVRFVDRLFLFALFVFVSAAVNILVYWAGQINIMFSSGFCSNSFFCLRYKITKTISVLLYWTTVQFKILNCRSFSDGFVVYFITAF
jgi:hypothetical protein